MNLPYQCESEPRGCNNIIIGHNSDMHQSNNNCTIVGVNSYIPKCAENCHIIGNDVCLTTNDKIKNVIYLGNCKDTFLIKDFPMIQNRLNKLFNSIADLNTDEHVFIPVDGQYIDIGDKLRELDKKISILENSFCQQSLNYYNL